MFFIFFIVVLFFLLVTSGIGIEIKNLKIDTELPKGKRINDDSKIFISVLLFNKISFFKINIKNINKRRIKVSNNKIKFVNLVRKLDIDFKKINLKVDLGTSDAARTAILVGFISTILGILLKKPKYEVKPIYSDKNILKIEIDCIISIYLMQYIYKIILNNIKEFAKALNRKKVEI